MRILVVDDEKDLCQILKYNLEESGFEVELAHSGEEALSKDIASFNLILLDIMMDGMSGYDFLDILRKELKSRIPVVFLTAMDSEEHLLQGFERGADDYVKKPFSIKEVVARIKAVLERNKARYDNQDALQPINVDNVGKTVVVEGEPISLTKTEFDIFTMLFTQPGKVYSRDEILRKIWSDQEFVLGRTVDVNITRIRKKLGFYGKCIVTRSGYGYYFDTKKTYSSALKI